MASTDTVSLSASNPEDTRKNESSHDHTNAADSSSNPDKIKKNTEEDIEFVPSTFTVHCFTAQISDQNVLYQVIKMQDSVLIFVNNQDNMQLNNLSLALMNRFSDSPIGTRLVGSFADETSKNIACRLVKKLNKTVFVSFNLEVDARTLPLYEKRIFEEIKARPEMF